MVELVYSASWFVRSDVHCPVHPFISHAFLFILSFAWFWFLSFTPFDRNRVLLLSCGASSPGPPPPQQGEAGPEARGAPAAAGAGAAAADTGPAADAASAAAQEAGWAAPAEAAAGLLPVPGALALSLACLSTGEDGHDPKKRPADAEDVLQVLLSLWVFSSFLPFNFPILSKKSFRYIFCSFQFWHEHWCLGFHTS